VHYEDLVQNPRETLARIGEFIEHDLDYDRIQQVALGSVHNPNSSFRGDGKETEAPPSGAGSACSPRCRFAILNRASGLAF